MTVSMKLLTSLLGATLALLVGPLAPAASAQALAFEEVGDRPLDADDLAFADDSTLWAIKSDIWRLLPDDGVWEEVASISATRYVLALGSDTLLAGQGRVLRSTDGGQTFTQVHDEGEALFEAPHSGTLLAGTDPGTSGVAYSHDRGATWQQATLLDPSTGAWALAFAELPPGHAHAGRLLAATWDGLSYSDDGGATWAPSSLWGDAVSAWSVAVGVDGTAYGVFSEVGVTGMQVAASADGGETWVAAHQFGELVLVGGWVFAVAGGADPEVGVVLVVQVDGSVRRSDDGGETWREVGRARRAFLYDDSFVLDAELGPDGRLYLAGAQYGPDREWVVRTAGPAVAEAVGVEAEAVSPPVVIGSEGGAFDFRVRLTNQTTVPLAFEGWSAVEGPVSREPVVGPVPVTLMPGQQLVRTVRQAVPGRAPAGEYTYTVRAGELGGVVLSEASFTFEKAAGVAPSVGAEDWTARGWADAVAEAPAADLTLSITPNPSRGAATVTLSLDAASEATVGLYDVLGRQVAVLHEGPLRAGRHELPIEAGALPPGLYVVRVGVGDAVRTARVTLIR